VSSAGETLRLAREARGLTLSETAARVGVSVATVSKIETDSLPAGPRLQALADALDYPTALFEKGVSPALSTAAPYFRRRKTTSARRVRQLEAMTNLVARHVGALLSNVDVEFDRALTSADLDEVDGDFERGADLIRSMLGLPFGPVRDLVGRVEAAGVIVLQVPPPVAGFDGVSVWMPEGLGLVLVNEDMPGDRQRFTILHEIVHLVFHHGWPRPDPETEANRIASATLMPAAVIGPELKGLTVRRALELKPMWGVAASALIERAYHLDLLSERTRGRMHARLRGMTGSVRETVQITPERPRLMRRIVASYLVDMGYTVEEAATQALMTPPRFRELFGIDDPPGEPGPRRLHVLS
jgi:Zn-dependent peptidase ImmA (M78 family)